MGENGSVLVNKDGSTIVQPAILAPKVVDTTGAGDTFTAAYAVALIERHSPADALRFAGTLSLQVTHAFELFISFYLLLQATIILVRYCSFVRYVAYYGHFHRYI